MRHFLGQERAQQDRLGRPAVCCVEARQDAKPRVNVARRAGEAGRYHVRAEMLFEELFREAVDVAADDVVLRPQRRAVRGVGEERGDRLASFDARQLEHLHLGVSRPGGVAAQHDLFVARGVAHLLPPIRAHGRRSRTHTKLNGGQPAQRRPNGLDQIALQRLSVFGIVGVALGRVEGDVRRAVRVDRAQEHLFGLQPARVQDGLAYPLTRAAVEPDDVRGDEHESLACVIEGDHPRGQGIMDAFREALAAFVA